ncbi:MAG TPA: dihydroorotate dehydrogenase electron transfer subunit [Actinomycetota bacterium]|nr:dihydroorotate dehydrogenase electron transfer subunit [Actinomycetota bacterium]
MRRVRAEILSVRRHGAYHTVTVVAPEVAERARPGQFVAVAPPPGGAALLRRHFFVHRASRRGGWAGTLGFAFDVRGTGTAWLAEARAHSTLDLIGPLGTGFAYPRRLSNCLLVGEGHGVAPLHFLAEELRARGKRVDMLVGADGIEAVFEPIEGKRLATNIAILTEDGSMGERGRVTDLLPEAIERWGTEVVYVAAPEPTLRRAAEVCRELRVPAQVAVEGPMACGVGLCFTCVVPVLRRDGTGYDNLRACVEGPVFNARRISWDLWPRPRASAGGG